MSIRIPATLAVTLVIALGACSEGGSVAQAAEQKPGSSAAAQRWTTFTDPVEGAFSVQVPAGWRAEGGVMRISSVEVRYQVVMRSPDNAIALFIGDNSVPVFALPSAQLNFAGFPEGSRYSPGYGQTFLVGQYRTGQQFAATLGGAPIAPWCPGHRVTASRDLPQATRAIGAAFAQGGVRTTVVAGEAEYACSRPDGAGRAYVFAATKRVEQPPMGGIWNVEITAGFAVRADREAEAAALLAQAMNSFRISPRWAQMQSGVAGDTSVIVAGTSSAISETIRTGFEARQATNARVMEDGSLARRGNELYDDPVDGRVERQAAPHTWRLPNGQVVTTQTSDSPAVGAVELQRAQR